MWNKTKNVAYYLFFLGLAVAAMYYCFKTIKIEDFVSQLTEANYFFIVLSILMGVAAYVIRTLRWRILIKPLGYTPSSYNVYNATMIGYLANLAVPRIGEVTRCAVLNKTDKIPGNSLFGTVVVERVIDLISLFVICILVFFLKMDFFTRFISEQIAPAWNNIFSNISGLMILIACITAICALAILVLLRRKLAKLTFVQKIKSLFQGVVTGLKTIFKMKQYPLFILYTASLWICYWLMSYCVVVALPATAGLGPVDGLFLMALGSMGWVIPAPGGMGSFHFIITEGLKMYGIEKGMVFATISHESQVLTMIILGLIALISVSVRKLDINR
jgi:uncharacterized protein (TIRG00374 family)